MARINPKIRPTPSSWMEGAVGPARLNAASFFPGIRRCLSERAAVGPLMAFLLSFLRNSGGNVFSGVSRATCWYLAEAGNPPIAGRDSWRNAESFLSKYYPPRGRWYTITLITKPEAACQANCALNPMRKLSTGISTTELWSLRQPSHSGEPSHTIYSATPTMRPDRGP